MFFYKGGLDRNLFKSGTNASIQGYKYGAEQATENTLGGSGVVFSQADGTFGSGSLLVASTSRRGLTKQGDWRCRTRGTTARGS